MLLAACHLDSAPHGPDSRAGSPRQGYQTMNSDNSQQSVNGEHGRIVVDMVKEAGVRGAGAVLQAPYHGGVARHLARPRAGIPEPKKSGLRSPKSEVASGRGLMSLLKKLSALLAGAVVVGALHGPALAQTNTADDVARFLAGMQPAANSPAAALTRSPGWQRHAKWLESNWDALEKRQLSKVRAWSERHLKDRQNTLYYMFSGPDFLYANAFFPEANTYLMSGLEPVGAIPNVSERTVASLPRIEHSIGTSLRLSFFITQQMSKQLSGGDLAGTLPILYVYIARSGRTIREVSLVNLDKNGTLHPAMGDARGMVPGVKIVLRAANGPPQTLYYFRTDVSNGGVNNSGFLKFAATLGNGNALLKSASYLMHSGNFTQVRDFVLQHSQQIVQDDSGIPLAALRPEVWELRPFGAYLGPIAVFPGRGQPKLAELFKKAKAPPLDFGIGYRHRGHDSNLLLAVRREPLKLSAPQTSQATPPAIASPPAAVPPPAAPPPVPPAPIPTVEQAPAPADRQE
ncbi:MAG: hypothetical protein IT538_03650 [Variibacter sp.]|nr:hypothetical protein [Variibacter sp.]